jgi:enoyl-CoA hydratase/carnithine racemase
MLDEAGRVTGPLVLVDLGQGDPPVPPADGRLVIGVARAPLPQPPGKVLDALDLALVPGGPQEATVPRQCVAVADPAAEAAALADVVARFPQACLVLGQVLRATQALPVLAALDVESFAYSTLLGGAEFRRWLAGRGDLSQPGLVADPVLIGRDGPELTITLNRPDRRNAYGRQLRDALTDALRVALADPGIRVVLNGNGLDFCSGGDLAEFGTAPDPVTAHFVRTLAGAGRLLHELRDRVEVRVHGACVGAGTELPSFAGRVIAPETAWFSLPEVSMGLIPGAGGTVSIPRRIGRWRTLYLALAGRAVNAATAQAWGLVDVAFPVLPPVAAPPAAVPPAGPWQPLLIGSDVGGRLGVGAGPVEGTVGRAQQAAGEDALGQEVHLKRLAGHPEAQEAGQGVPQEDRRTGNGQRHPAKGDADRGARGQRVRGAGRDQVGDHAQGDAGGHSRRAEALP